MVGVEARMVESSVTSAEAAAAVLEQLVPVDGRQSPPDLELAAALKTSIPVTVAGSSKPAGRTPVQ